MRRALFALALLLSACTPNEPAVLDKRAVLERQTFWDNRDFDWYAENVPFFESPDSVIDRTYWYRWEVVTKHLTYGSPTSGYTFTEFIDRPFWSGTYGGISCPLGHQIEEVRWLKDRRVIDDFSAYWFETEGAQPRSYSNWYGDAVWDTYLVTGDREYLERMFPHMLEQYAGWMAERWDEEHRMFRWDGMHDGMETNITSRQTVAPFDGAVGYRPTLNSYLFADARAIANAAAVLGDSLVALDYAARAAELKQRVQDELWDPSREFFFHQFAFDEKDGIQAKSLTYETGPYAGSPYGREAIGFVPWQFHLPDPGYEAAWRTLTDSSRFAAPFGPTTTERNDPLFWVSPRCCEWSGNQWPYATTQTLQGLANLLNDYDQQVMTKQDYFGVLKTYARLHEKEGRPYIAEAADPFTGSWAGHDTYYHSEHYFHSAFVDLVITGLVGLRPRPDDIIEVNPLVPDAWPYFALDDVAYRGRRLSILWDRDGSRYGRGAGLSILLDGETVARREDLGRLEVPFEPFEPRRYERPANWAVNNDGGHFPFVETSSADPLHPPFWAQDGNRWYHESPPNFWSSGAPSVNESWIRVDFGVERPISTLKLYFMDGVKGTKAPKEFRIEILRKGEWVSAEGSRVPASPEGRRANRVEFGRINTSSLRVVFTPDGDAPVGLTEIEAWGPHEGEVPAPTEAPRNVALEGVFSASYSSPYDTVGEAFDGRFGITHYSRNRWTAFESPNAEDWIAVAWDEPRRVGSVELTFWGDNRGVGAPEAYRIEAQVGGAWVPVVETSREPADALPSARHTVRFEAVEAEAVRAVFRHAPPRFTGVTEMRVLAAE